MKTTFKLWTAIFLVMCAVCLMAEQAAPPLQPTLADLQHKIAELEFQNAQLRSQVADLFKQLAAVDAQQAQAKIQALDKIAKEEADAKKPKEAKGSTVPASKPN